MSGRLEFSRAEKSRELYIFKLRLPDGIVLEACTFVMLLSKPEPLVAPLVNEKILEEVLAKRRDKI